MVLESTQLGKNPQEGYALLGVSLASPQTYRAGAILANGARISSIYADYIELERDGQVAKLYVNGAQAADTASPLTQVGGQPPVPAAVANSADALTDVIRVTPMYRGREVQGLEVFANERSNIFAQLGLEPGDRITAIDGERITDSAAGIASLRRLTEGSALQVNVDRRGKPVFLSLDGALLAARNKIEH